MAYRFWQLRDEEDDASEANELDSSMLEAANRFMMGIVTNTELSLSQSPHPTASALSSASTRNQPYMLIEIQDVSVERGSTRILNRVNLDIPQGQHVAIVGPNGSGKSTLLKLLMKFFYPSVVDGQSGTIRILGHEEWNVWELRRHLGFC